MIINSEKYQCFMISIFWNILNETIIFNIRQTTSFIELSIEAGILLGGNGALRAMLVARHIARRLTRC